MGRKSTSGGIRFCVDGRLELWLTTVSPEVRRVARLSGRGARRCSGGEVTRCQRLSDLRARRGCGLGAGAVEPGGGVEIL